MTQKKAKNPMGKFKHYKTIVDGITFDSQTEAEYYEYIISNKKSLNIKEVELQPEFILQEKCILIDGTIHFCDDEKEFKKLQKKHPKCTIQSILYIADFKITYNDNKVDIIDIKGLKTTDFKIKEKLFNYKYPEYDKLKCIAKYKGQWLLWDDYKKAQKENSKKPSNKKPEKKK